MKRYEEGWGGMGGGVRRVEEGWEEREGRGTVEIECRRSGNPDASECGSVSEGECEI